MHLHKGLRILLANVDCGGGHRALLECLQNTIPNGKNRTVHVYASKTQIYDRVYRVFVRYTTLYLFMRKHTRFFMRLFRYLIIVPEYANSKQIIRAVNPDIVICTNPLQPIIFETIKKRLNSNYEVVLCVSDYGDQKAYIDSAPNLNSYLVRDASTKSALSQYVEPTSLILFGTEVNPDFKRVRELDRTSLRQEFLEFLKEHFLDIEDDPHKTKVLIMGGSGWVRKSVELINALARQPNYQIFVACGRDTTFLRSIMNVNRVYPFGFISQRKLAVVTRSVNALVLSSLAPATMHELFTLNEHPLFVHRFIQGQETPHIKLIHQWNVGIYEPDTEMMIQAICDYTANRARYDPMLENARRIQCDHSLRAERNSEIINEIYRNLKEEKQIKRSRIQGTR